MNQILLIINKDYIIWLYKDESYSFNSTSHITYYISLRSMSNCYPMVRRQYEILCLRL